jgi:N-acetylglucosamine-6-sulfatase
MHRLLLLAFVWLSLGSLHAASARPNILFVFSDDHALQAIGAYGSRINLTPNIDRLAHEGALFVNSFCANSICGPSRANILTGKHSHRNGFLRNGNRFDGTQTTFPQLLRQTGYQTALLGKWHLDSNPTGFDHWEVLPDQGNYYNPDFIQMDGSMKRHDGYVTDIITEKTLDWLNHRRDPDKPFLLMCQHKAPHRNWAPAPRHLGLYDDRAFPEPDTLFDDYSGRSPLLRENEMSIQHHFFWAHDMKFHGDNLFPRHFLSGNANAEYRRMTDTQRQLWDAHYEAPNQRFIAQMRAGQLSDVDVVRWKFQRYLQDYLGCVAAVDESVGRILDYLDTSGLATNTVVIYSSDQGFYLGEHGWYDKRWMFEESLRMPFLIRWPEVVVPGSRPAALIQNIDYAPTFLEMAGAEIPADIQGRSLLPLLQRPNQPPTDWRDAVYYAYYENAAVHNVPVHDGIRTDRYKLMFFARTAEWQLFDLQQDPAELRSLHADPAHAKILDGLQKRYRDLRKLYDVNSAVIPTTRGDETWWRDRYETVNARARQDAELLFIGDSITQGWEAVGKEIWNEFYAPRNAINLGFSGDRTEHLIWRLSQGHLGNGKAKVAVILIGTNNTGHRMQDPQETARGIHRAIQILRERSPHTKILLLGLFPRAEDPWDPARLNNIAINQIIRRYADDSTVFYRDIGAAFLAPDGALPKSMMPDFLHLSEQGYRRWAEAIEPTLRQLGL